MGRDQADALECGVRHRSMHYGHSPALSAAVGSHSGCACKRWHRSACCCACRRACRRAYGVSAGVNTFFLFIGSIHLISSIYSQVPSNNRFRLSIGTAWRTSTRRTWCTATSSRRTCWCIQHTTQRNDTHATGLTTRQRATVRAARVYWRNAPVRAARRVPRTGAPRGTHAGSRSHTHVCFSHGAPLHAAAQHTPTVN